MGETDGHEIGAAERGWLGLPKPLRWVLRYALMAVVSITLGRIVELVAEQVKHNTERVAESFADAEKGAIASVGRLRPTALARLYLTALQGTPSPLFLRDRQMMDDAEALARARARISAMRPHAGTDAVASLDAAEALLAKHRAPSTAVPGAPAFRDYVNSLPEPSGAAAASRALGTPGAHAPSELSKIFQDTPGAVHPATSLSDQLAALGSAPASPPARSAPGAPATSGLAVPVPPPPSALLPPRAVPGPTPAFDRAARPQSPPEDPNAGPSVEEQALGVRLHHWVHGRGNWLSPVTALADVMSTLATSGAWAGRIVMFLQLLFGLILAGPVIAWLGDQKRGGDAAGPIWVMGGPFLAVGLGSLVSLAVWALMAGAHKLFGGFTHIPGLSIGLGTAGFCCWHVSWRAAELALGHPVERLIERV